MPYKWDQMSFQDAQQFNNVPAKPSTSYERVPDSNPTAPHDWRDGDRVEREQIPSMVIGATGFNRCSKRAPKYTSVLDILIRREERALNRITETRVVKTHITITSLLPTDSPKEQFLGTGFGRWDRRFGVYA